MTAGTSQGLFLVVAIVIFGIFVGTSYVLFGDVLQPKIENLFKEAIAIADESINKKEHVNFVPDANFENELLTYSYIDARNSRREIDYDVLKDGKNTLKTSYTTVSESDGEFHDTLVWLRNDTFKNAIPKDTLYISFYVKANKKVTLVSRLGGSFLQAVPYDNLNYTEISEEWTKVTYSYSIERGYTVPSDPAFVYWVDNADAQTDVWISDLKVSLNSIFVNLEK